MPYPGLYYFRYCDVKGRLHDDFLQAMTPTRAERAANAWCGETGAKFVFVELATIATDEDLDLDEGSVSPPKERVGA